MNFWFIGLLGGTVLGLTGAGGAIISMPLLVHFLGFSFREATIASLLLVWISALLNGWLQRKAGQPKTALTLALFSIVGAFLAAFVKAHLHEWVLKFLFAGLCILSAIRIWQPWRESKWKMNTGAFGLCIGALTTFTGLSGGVLTVPWLVSQRGLSLGAATATSLMAIFFTASSSLLAQAHILRQFLPFSAAVGICGGAVLSAVPTFAIIRLGDETKIDLFRKILLSTVIAISLTSFLF